MKGAPAPAPAGRAVPMRGEAAALEAAQMNETELEREESERQAAAAAPVRSEEEERAARLLHLYSHAGDLEVEMGAITRRDPDTALTAAQVGRYNQIVRDAREALPSSVALREDAAEIDESAWQGVRAADIFRVLHTAVVPTLHNALPEDEYARR